MTDDPNDDIPSNDAKALWRAQQTETPPMTLAQIHARSFQTRIRWRNGREYVACAIVIGLSLWLAARTDQSFVRVGMILGAVGALVAAWQLYRRAAARTVPAATASDSLAFHREQLVRQRDALRSVWLWYLAPFVPAWLTIVAGRFLTRPDEWVRITIGFSISLAIFVGIAALNRWGARRLQAQIDELDALGEGR